MPNREGGGGSILKLGIFDNPNKSKNPKHDAVTTQKHSVMRQDDQSLFLPHPYGQIKIKEYIPFFRVGTKTSAARDDIPAPVGQSRRATPEATPSTPREQQEAAIVGAGAGDSLNAEAPCNASSVTLGASQTRCLGLRIIFPDLFQVGCALRHKSSISKWNIKQVSRIGCASRHSFILAKLAGISRNYTRIIAQNFAPGGSGTEYNTEVYLNSRLPGHGIAEPVEAWLLAGEAAKILEENSWRRILTNQTETEDERDLPSRRDDLENS
ncbi:type 2 lantipeptide synthetase LanM [Sesbania bispinosa]|nr:type 2 lantipeptide synthetase LanM [Sesbania bispinosa]